MKEMNLELGALEEVAYGTQHALGVLIDLLVSKGIISEQELRNKLNEMIDESPDFVDAGIAGANIALPEDDEE